MSRLHGTESRESTRTLAIVEWEHIQSAMSECHGNISHAARLLGLHRRSLQRILKKGPPKPHRSAKARDTFAARQLVSA